MAKPTAAQSGILDELQANPVDSTEEGIVGEKSDGSRVLVTPEGEVREVAAESAGEAPAAEEKPAENEKSVSREVLPDTAGAAITVPARLGFEQQQVVAIKNTVAKDCNPAELVMFLEVAARYALDPFAKQIYAAKMKGRVVIIVSRDGLLAHAHRQADFVRMDGDVVHENDDFKVVFKDGERKIEHAYETKSDPAKSGPEGEAVDPRGRIIGAWTRVVREGHGETYFYAPMNEYARTGETPWAKTPSAMILKCAETYALRKGWSISGVVGEDEIEKQRKTLTEVEGGAEASAALDLGPEPRAGYIRELAQIANELVPGSYRPAKLMGLAGDLDGLVNELSAFISERDGEVPAEPIDGDAVEVVDEGAQVDEQPVAA